MSWRAIVETLGMRQHPEGGWYVETWRAPSAAGERPAASAILFLLAAGTRSHWHRVDAAEVWQWSAGAPLELRIAEMPDGAVETVRLGADVLAGQRPQAVVPVGAWQAAASLGDWTLVGCIVAPAFEFGGFELAEPGWAPGPEDWRPVTRSASRSAPCSSGSTPGTRHPRGPTGGRRRMGRGR